jgi:cytochrome b561
MAPTPNLVVPLAFAALIVWRVYRRVRRSVGRQPLRRKRSTATIVIYSVILVLLVVGAMANLKVLAGLAAGLVVGVPLALAGLHLTRFETAPEGVFYIPNPYIGVSIAAVLVIRVFYRFTVIFANGPPRQNPQMFQSPLTFSLFGLLAGYYIAYNAGLLIRGGKANA